MKFIIEFDGPIIDLRAVYHQAHREVAAELGWSHLDEPNFWRILRTKGSDPTLLPGARPLKVEQYTARFAARLEDEEIIARYRPHDDLRGLLRQLNRHGVCTLVTLGRNVIARSRMLRDADLMDFFDTLQALNADPRRRPGELAALAGGDARTIVVAAGDSVVRAAGAAELLAVGLTCGPCIAARLHQAGADVVYPGLRALVDSLSDGAPDLIRAGLLPPPMN